MKPIGYYCLSYLPKNVFSRLCGWVADRSLPQPLQKWLITLFVIVFKIDMSDYEKPIDAYSTFNEFFTRRFKDGVRVIAQENDSLVSPVDGTIGEFGTIEGDKLIQAKGLFYSLADLFNDFAVAKEYEDGEFITIYLAPHNYHRIHSMVEGKITRFSYIPGELWTVSPLGVNYVPNLFSRNERLTSFIQTQYGNCALVKVGATVVGKIKVVYDSTESNLVDAQRKEVTLSSPYAVKQGTEIGRFELGSTVIGLFPKQMIQWNPDLKAGQTLVFGQKIASLGKPS